MKTIKFDKNYLWVYSEVNKNGCWIWQGYCNPDGYAQRKNGGVTYRMHRVSYQLFKEEIPKGMHVLHSCDTPSCINPEHLFLGTHSDNMKDMWSKGRHPIPTHRPSAKLTENEAKIVKYSKGTLSGKELASRFKISVKTVYAVWQRRIWCEI